LQKHIVKHVFDNMLQRQEFTHYKQNLETIYCPNVKGNSD